MTSNPAIVVVDPVSTGLFFLNSVLQHNDLVVIAVWSASITPSAKALVVPGLNTKASHDIDFTTLPETVAAIQSLNYNIVHVIALCETGVDTADLLASELTPKLANDLAYSAERRDKYKQVEAVGAAGLRVAKQALITSYEQCVAFVESNQCDAYVIKPINSAGSDDVYKIPAGNLDLLKQRVDSVLGKTNKLGFVNEQLLIQEFLVGDEYVIDIVSLNGVHKLGACWKYMKTSLPQGDFVYLGMLLQDTSNPIVQQAFEYTKRALDALHIKNYASHSELIYNPIKKDVALVECGARPHGGMGMFLPASERVVGYSIIDLLEAACLGNANHNDNDNIPHIQSEQRYFDQYPELYPTLDNQFGCSVDLVSFVQGKLLAYGEELELVKQLPTFVGFFNLPQIGSKIPLTVDCFTTAGALTLVGDETQVMIDLEKIRQLERNLFIVAQEESAN